MRVVPMLLALAALLAACDVTGGGSGNEGVADAASTEDVTSMPDEAATGDPGGDPAVDPGADPAVDAVVDVPAEALADATTDAAADVPVDAPVNPCGEGGVCVEPGDDCPAAWLVMTQKGCVTPAGHDTGSCCIPGGECKTDADCPGCEVCDLPAEGGYACVDPFSGGGVQCTNRLDCPESHCCSYTLLAAKPLCHGLCMFDDGSADCHFCTGEGGQISGESEVCCPGLQKIPMPMMSEQHCIPSRCFCDTCVKRCGDGLCTEGEDACRCPADCPYSFAKGPGAACATDADCDPGTCLPEASGYPAGGYCTGGVCDPNDTSFLKDLCPSGSACTGTWFAQAYLCMPTCRKDADCRDGLTCEAFPEPYAAAGALRCWQAGGTQAAGLGQACAKDGDCISGLCLAAPGGAKVCSSFCNDETPCREGMTCKPMGGCGWPGCGACFAL
jgi:hypothetical protein